MRAAPPKEHPLAGRCVVLSRDLPNGADVQVIDWVSRVPDYRPGSRIRRHGRVLVRRGLRVFAVSAFELPSYDPVPVGVIS